MNDERDILDVQTFQRLFLDMSLLNLIIEPLRKARRMPRALDGDEFERGWFKEGDAITFLT